MMIDTHLYDRQIRTIGMTALQKLTQSSVLVIGLNKGLATEICKNLALGGVKNIILFDDNGKVQLRDLETGFYYKKIGSNYSHELKEKIQELNPYITVSSVNTYDCGQTVTILINQDDKIINFISDTIKSKIVAVFSTGHIGSIFVDAGHNHLITDLTGEIINPVQIGSISTDGIVTCAPNNSHDFQNEDYITFTNLEGDNLKDFKNEFQITIINKVSFKINNFNIIDFKFINGTVVYIKKPITISHQPWKKYSPSIQTQVYSDYDYEFLPIVSLIGSFAASETSKLITNKYMPINQWFSWTDDALIPRRIENSNKNASSYLKWFGLEFDKKFNNLNILIIGAGAIGCEYIKNLAFMMQGGSITIIDPDFIEKSNLNRQLLYRNHHIGKPKCVIAGEYINSINPRIKVISIVEKVGVDNILLTDRILPTIDIVLNALDNISARKFMDEQCFKYNKPLFESGTTGTKGNIQPIIPFLTETYSASNDPPDTKSFPACTIKSFPNEVQHTIHWAMDQFDMFIRVPCTLNKLIDNPNYLSTLEEIEKDQAIKDINVYKKYFTEELYVKFALEMFNENYELSINQLLEKFSPTHEISEGVLFWSNGKRCPKPITFDIDNELHIDYIEATVNLLILCSDIYKPLSREQIKLIITKPESTNSSEECILLKKKYKPQVLEKDDDSNWHIKWITSASNLRNINYSIPIISFYETKGIAGKIIPAIVTTTSAVAGLTIIEMMKYLLNMELKDYRSTFINLAEPLLVYSEPIQAPMITIAGNEINSWTKFEYTKDTSLNEFKLYFEKLFKITITMIVFGTCILYADFMNDEEPLNKLLSENISSELKNITINIMTSDETELPSIIVNI